MWDSALYLPTKWSSTLVSDGLGGFYAVGIQNYPGKVIIYQVDRRGNILLDNWNYEDETTGIEPESHRFSVYPDGYNGLLLTCINYNDIIHLLRIDPSGNILWENHGADIVIPGIVDEFGNWFDLYAKDDSTYKVYIRKYDVNGNSLWNGKLVKIRTEDWGWLSPWSHVLDQNGGLIMLWSETRHLTQYWDIMGQQVNSDGQLGIVLNSIKSTEMYLPQKLNIIKCYPNPFNISTTIAYSVVNAGTINISIFDINGKMVYRKILAQNQPGEYYYSWNGQNTNSNILSSGIYFIRVSDDNNSCIVKTVLLK